MEASFYKIPRFQRPYSWDRENVADFWEDAVLAEDPDYFIGSFVLYKSKDDQDLLYIVDGQQRLTTITLLLAATRDALDHLGFAQLARAVQKLIEREDINSELRFVLDSETPYPYLQEMIQKFGDRENILEVGSEQEALKSAYDYFQQQISSTLESVDLDNTVSSSKKITQKRGKLIQIRDRLLRLQLITVQLGNEDDAYLIFETLNTRGKDLTVSDLVKNHLTRLLRPKHKGVDLVKDKWSGILEHFHQSEAEININRFLHHSWLSRAPYTTEKGLFKEIKKLVTRGSAGGFLDDLVLDARLYRQVLEPDSYKWAKQEREIADALRALAVFRVIQPVPMLLALLRDYRAKSLTLSQVRNVFQRMEDFHVQFTAVTSQRTGGGTAFMYASSARQLLEASDKNSKQGVLTEFIAKLRDRVPSAEEFDAGFVDIYFTDKNTRYRQLVRYLLRRLHEYLRGEDEAPDYEKFNIEHLASQNSVSSNRISDEYIGQIGNLVFLPVALNESLANKPAEEKLKRLKEKKVPLDENLKIARDWTAEAIKSRTDALSALFREKILKV